MTTGRKHAIVATVIMAGTVVATPYVASHVGTDIAAGLVIGALAGLICSPDLDLEDCRTFDEQRMFRLFGTLAGRLWQWFWMGYARHHSHRGSSHRPIVGTAGRWWHVWTHLLFLPLVLVWINPELALAAFVANCLQDIGHLVFDGWRYHRGR